MTQSELQLENELVEQLSHLGFNKVNIVDSSALQSNLKSQLEKFNQTIFSDSEFSRVLNHLNKGDRFEKAKSLRDRFVLSRDDESTTWIRFFNTEEWCKNEYQVTHQVTQMGKYENRYDVTLLINGLPLVQIELKKRGIEMEEAFNQIQRYHKHSFTGTLFEYIQVFIISNGVNTKYFANNPKQTFEQTFFWTDENNNKITALDKFTEVFLEKCAISEFIAEYTVLASTGIPMVLRPYQYYAARKIEKRVKETTTNGYIWHTTGSGKTLTAFKTSQLLSKLPTIKKVLFVVDRKDLDTKTIEDFNDYSKGSVDSTTNTSTLVKQLKDENPKKKLIVTTVQKLDIAISKEYYLKQFENLKDEKIVIIFDECHRSQFGQTHAHIKSFFKKAQLFGFTGTPIFQENNIGGVTTKDVFEECLHKYIITHAIADKNVLGFSVEYVGKYKQKDADTLSADILVEGIDTKEVLENPDRLNKITDWILDDWKRKTKSGKFNAIFAVTNIDVLKKYYKLIQVKKSETLKVATIFSYQANEEESTDMLDVDIFADENTAVNQHSRDFLEDCIKDYNMLYSTNFSTNEFYDYFRDVQKRLKNKQIDLLLVVNMLLTGFDSPRLNTLYVDKNLKYHGLIQAYSRTNRLLDSTKPHGNIVSFRNLKQATDEALKLFGDEDAKEIVFKKPFEQQKKDFEEKLNELKTLVPTIYDVDKLESELEKAAFVKAFRDLLRIKSSLETFAEFDFKNLNITEQEFLDYQSKYLDIYEGRSNNTDKESILDQIDFEIELTLKDIINFDYIILLISQLKNIESDSIREKKIDDILKIFDRDIQLRKKKELIKKFIEENLPNIATAEDVQKEFTKYFAEKRLQRINEVADEENIKVEDIEKLIGEFAYTQKFPREQDIADVIQKPIPIIGRHNLLSKIKNSIESIVEIFEW